jgi:TolB-like protein/Tfp pilus assembly protein PilF
MIESRQSIAVPTPLRVLARRPAFRDPAGVVTKMDGAMVEPGPGESAITIALLRFDNPSGDPEQDYFARGFVEDVATELSRFPTLEVIHPTTSFALGSGPPASQRLPGLLRGGYLLRGSVRRLGDVTRVAAQLVEASSGRQVWAERFDAPAEGLLSVQDQIVAQVASTLAISIDGARLQHARRQPLSSLEVYDCWLRGLACLRRGTVEDDARARTFFERAVALDPHYARAYAGLSLSHFNEWSCQAWELWDEKERLAFEYARRAAELDDRDGLVQLVLGRIFAYRRQFDEAARHVDRAIELNPNDADVLAHGALCYAYLGQCDLAVRLARKGMRLNPSHPDWYLACAAFPLFFLRQYEESVALTSKVPRAFVDMPALLAAAHALLGDGARAAFYLEMFQSDFVEKVTFGRRPEPGEPLRWLLHVNPLRRPEHADLIARGLRLAGLPADPDEGRLRAMARPASDDLGGAVFRREDAFWTLAFEGIVVQLTEVKGFHDLAMLLAQPHSPIHALDLAGRSEEPRGHDPMLDRRARRELGARVQALQAEIDEAQSLNDHARAEQARAELDRLVTVLSQALGLGGRSRRLGSATERARTAVTWRIRNAIGKIAAAHPTLGRHLHHGVRTGTSCVYAPEKPIDWSI